MRAIGVHEDVIVVESRIWRTTATLIRSGDEAFLIDSPVFPDELEMLPSLFEQAHFSFSGLLATHGDWDHLLGRLAFPEASLGVAETTAARLRANPGVAQRELREFDERYYVERRAPLALGSAEALPVPGYCGLGSHDLELHPADGHTADGMAVWAPWAKVLICGDYLSPIEIPTPEASIDGYLATLERLEPLVEQAEWVVPGHGEPIESGEARRLVEEDRAYLRALEAGATAMSCMPLGRRNGEQRRLHTANVVRLARD